MITCSKCEKEATVMIKPYDAAYESPYCEEHGKELQTNLESEKLGYGLSHITQPTPEQELLAKIATLTQERDDAQKEVLQLRKDVMNHKAEIEKLQK